MDTLTLGLFIVGLVLLTLGADVLVKGAAHLAGALGISPLIIGLTVVAFGTSAPELAVSTSAAWNGQADLALGNVVGSNIFNVLFILGISALIAPLLVQQQLIRVDVPVMIACSVLLLILGMDNLISRVDGVILFAGLLAYIFFLLKTARKESPEVQAEYLDGVDISEADGKPHWARNAAYIALGLIMLVVGSNWLVDGAIELARGFGVSELIIGLTIVAAGTSLPEVATSVMASIRGERDIAVGNVVGSNIFNILCVLGLSSIVSPAGITVAPSALSFDVPVMIAVAIACLPIFFAGRIISRGNGALLFGYYIAYTVFLVMAATGSPALTTLTQAMLWFALPLTVISLSIGAIREWKNPSAAQ
jgi:cation:H+ antiporter